MLRTERILRYIEDVEGRGVNMTAIFSCIKVNLIVGIDEYKLIYFFCGGGDNLANIVENQKEHNKAVYLYPNIGRK